MAENKRIPELEFFHPYKWSYTPTGHILNHHLRFLYNLVAKSSNFKKKTRIFPGMAEQPSKKIYVALENVTGPVKKKHDESY